MLDYKLIPKTESLTPKYKETGRGVLSVLPFIIFFVSFTAFGGVLSYNWYLGNQIKAYTASFEKIKSEIELESITELVKQSENIETAKQIILNHKILSGVFAAIEKNTLKNNYFASFSFKYKNESRDLKTPAAPMLNLQGVAKSYSDLAKQMKVFKSAQDFEKTDFSDFKLLEDGDISYDLNLTVKNSFIRN